MSSDFTRREFVGALALLPFAADAVLAQTIPVIDSHIHLFDKARPEGSAWPPADMLAPGTSALPPRFAAVARSYGVVGGIAIEAQANTPRIEDNQWVLDQAAANPIIVGTVGRIDLASADFSASLERFRKDKLFLGIRQYQLAPALEMPLFMSNLKLLADAGLTVESLSPGTTDAVMATVRIADAIPSLRVIIDHYPNVKLPEDRAARDTYLAGLNELGKRPQVYMKLSEVVRTVGDKVSTDLAIYKDWLDQLWDAFGEDRIMFGSDWPRSEILELNSYRNVVGVARAYVNGKGRTAMEKVFWRNSLAAYRWIKRDPAQPQA